MAFSVFLVIYSGFVIIAALSLPALRSRDGGGDDGNDSGDAAEQAGREEPKYTYFG
jgi:hypothetical protein